MEKEYRIKKSEEIENILKGKKIVSDKFFTIYYKNNETKHFRLAISVSKKIGDAVTRNHQKRMIREAFRNIKSSLLPFDIFVICKADSLNLSLEEIIKFISKLLNKALIIKEKQ